MKQVLAEHDNKNAEYDVHLRKKEERCVIVENELRQRVQGKRHLFFINLLLTLYVKKKKKKQYWMVGNSQKM